jgi:hypothetical protein
MIDGERLLDPRIIPEALWARRSNTLTIPASLAMSYNAIIDRSGLRTLSESRGHEEGPVGGMSQEQTNLHFAQAFDGSMARMELALLDPLKVATVSSNALLISLSGNSVCLTDAPCGAGAAAFALLATIAELRLSRVLPRLPLDVFLIGAEISKPARSYAAALLEELRPSLEAQAIFVVEEFLDWDVTDRLSNTDLASQVTVKAASCSRKLLVVANFNGFLERSGKRAEAQRQIEELFRYSSGANSVAIWVEPDMNRATREGGLFGWIKSLLNTWNLFAQKSVDPTSGEPVSRCSARFVRPLDPTQTARVGLAVMRIDLLRPKQ